MKFATQSVLPVDKITSLQNPRIKAVCELQEKSRERRKQKLCVVEGQREIGLALEAGYEIDTLFCCPDIATTNDLEEQLNSSVSVVPVAIDVFRKMAYRESSDGLLALVRTREHTLNELKLSENPFLIVLEAVEKPGNLGAILRTADAAQADAVIVCDP